MDVDEPTAKAVGGEVLPMIFVVSKAIEYIKNQILDRVVSCPPRKPTSEAGLPCGNEKSRRSFHRAQ